MEKIKLGIFEVFTYILPGFFVVTGIYLLIYGTEDVISVLIDKSRDISLAQSILFLLTCYILGFINQYTAYELFKVLGNRIWKQRMQCHETSFGKMENEISQIRHFSPNNFNALHRWFALRAMCYGLFQAMLFFDMVLLVSTIQNNHWSNQRVVLLLVSGVMAILFLRRAVTFHEWSHRTIKYTIKHLDEFKKFQ
ncbi:MAG: hypothetical protein AB3N16_11225 [Flavobacteriaceae bacterium]